MSRHHTPERENRPGVGASTRALIRWNAATGPQAVLAENAEYLQAVRQLLGDDGQAYKQAIIERFPAYGVPS